MSWHSHIGINSPGKWGWKETFSASLTLRWYPPPPPPPPPPQIYNRINAGCLDKWQKRIFLFNSLHAQLRDFKISNNNSYFQDIQSQNYQIKLSVHLGYCEVGHHRQHKEISIKKMTCCFVMTFMNSHHKLWASWLLWEQWISFL